MAFCQKRGVKYLEKKKDRVLFSTLELIQKNTRKIDINPQNACLFVRQE